LIALNAADENGWALRFLLWAKGKRVKNVPLHRFAQHPKLLGWVVEQLDDLALLAMLRATTETGLTVAWQQPSPFTHGVLSVHPQRDGKWWAWLTVNEPEQIFPTAINALMDGAETLCFARLPVWACKCAFGNRSSPTEGKVGKSSWKGRDADVGNWRRVNGLPSSCRQAPQRPLPSRCPSAPYRVGALTGCVSLPSSASRCR
jgi:hypothetical protein